MTFALKACAFHRDRILSISSTIHSFSSRSIVRNWDMKFYFLVSIIEKNMNAKLAFTLKKALKITGGIICVMILCILLFSIMDIPYHDLSLIFSNSDYFWFNGRSLSILSTSPAYIFAIIYITITIFITDYEPSKNMTYRVNLFGFTLLAAFFLINVLSLFLYFYISFFTYYKPCQELEVQDYYVRNNNICNNIEKNKSHQKHSSYL